MISIQGVNAGDECDQPLGDRVARIAVSGRSPGELRRVRIHRAIERGLHVAPVGLAALGAVGLWAASRGYPGVNGDWTSYHAALDRLLSGGPLYTALQQHPYSLLQANYGGGYVYPLSSVPVLLLTAWVLPWRLLNLAILLLGVRVATRSWLAVAMMSAFAGTWATWANGNVMPAIVGLYGIAYGSTARWPAVIAGAIKVFPLTLLVLAWKRREPMTWALAASLVIAVMVLLDGFIPAFRNAEGICQGQPILALSCWSGGAAWAAAALLGTLAVVVQSDRLRFALLCVAPFLAAPDWTWAYWQLPMLGALVLLFRGVVPGPARFSSVPQSD